MKILVEKAAIITQNREREQIPCGYLFIENDQIKSIGRGLPPPELKADKKIDASGMSLCPGLINAHVHLGETIFRDFFFNDFTLERYLAMTEELTKKTDLIEAKRQTVCDYSLMQILKSGTTTISGGRTMAAETMGIRNVSGFMIQDSHKLKHFLEDLEKNFQAFLGQIEKMEISYPAIFIHSLNFAEPYLLKKVAELLQKNKDIRLFLHAGETKLQEDNVKSKFGQSSVQVLNKNNLLSRQTILIHGNWFDQTDLALIKERGSSLVHCLSSNLRVADRVLDLKNIINSGIKACLATDGVVTSGTFDVLTEASACCRRYGGQPVSEGFCQKIFDLITIEAADILGLDGQIGSLEIGKKADLILLKRKNISSDRLQDIVMGQPEVISVIINGRLMIENKVVLPANEEKIGVKFRQLIEDIKEEVK